jgi:hypothetical protein
MHLPFLQNKKAQPPKGHAFFYSTIWQVVPGYKRIAAGNSPLIPTNKFILPQTSEIICKSEQSFFDWLIRTYPIEN